MGLQWIRLLVSVIMIWQFEVLLNRCGVGNYGSLIVDQTDNCCRIHDHCYQRISGGWFGCSPKLVTYAWKGRLNHTIECHDSIGTCDRNACECDKAAVNCFANHRSSYQSSFLIKTNLELYEICNP